MITSKRFKESLYGLAAKSYFLNWLFLIIIAFGVVSWTTKFPGNLESNLWLYILISVLGLLSFLAWILVWGWYSVWFRYLAYGVARVISGIRIFLNNIVTQMLIILGFSLGIWLLRKQLLKGGFDSQDILGLISVIKTLVIAAALFTLWEICKSKKRIVILNFENFTGDDKLNPAIEGISSRCLSEMRRLLKLLKTIDEIQPDPAKSSQVSETTLDVQDIGKDFKEIIGPESSVKVGVVSIPLRPLYAFFQKLLHGPMLKGGVHLKGEKLILIACLHGGRFKESWEISVDHLKEIHIIPTSVTERIQMPPFSVTEQLVEMTNLLVCRILTDLSPDITPRWKAMHYFTEGLWFYRATRRTREKQELNLIKAKSAFSLAIRDDKEFVQCYYNFGIIYKELESWEAAKTAFRKALEKKPDYHRCYYELALMYFYNVDYFNAGWFCEQAIAICPTDPYYWNLLAIIRYYRWCNKEREEGREKELYNLTKPLNIPGEVVQSSMIGTMLAWRALCKSIIKGEISQEFKKTAQLCTRNLAVITGEKKSWRSRFYFDQAIFIDPDNNYLLFEAGQYFYRKDDIPNACKALKRVFEDDKEIDDPFSYWAFYINLNAKLYDKKRDKRQGKRKENDEMKKYKDVVNNGYIHFLDAAAEIIHKKDEEYADEYIKSNEKLVSEALELTKNNNNKAHKVCLLFDLIKLLPGIEKTDYIYKWIKEACERISQDKDKFPKDFFKWMGTQIAVNQALQIIEEEGNFFGAINKLKTAIEKLKDKYPNEIKMIGLYRHLATAYLLSGSSKEALKSAREAVRYDPYDPEVREVLGNVYFELKDYRQTLIEMQICFRLGKSTPYLDIFKKIGEAYIEEGKILCDPTKRKESFEKAIAFFREWHEIIEDKSYDKEDDRYIDILGRTHFFLASFYYELLKYDDAISHYQTHL